VKAFLTAEWRHLLVLSYPVDPALLEPWVPAGTILDEHAGRAWVSLVGFEFLETRVLGFSSPLHRNFEEVNLRFYVRREQPSESRRGVVFVKEIVRSPVIAAVARLVYNEPYQSMPMRRFVGERGGSSAVEYAWNHGGRRHSMGARFQGAPSVPEEGSLEAFVTDRAWGYGRDRAGRTLEYRVDHVPWRVWRSCDATLDCDVGSVYGAPFGRAIAGAPPSALVAEGSPVTVYRGSRLPAA
jgi:uncharacterized protein YqjF (DUF2071 family)